jgi:hypothetical protein
LSENFSAEMELCKNRSLSAEAAATTLLLLLMAPAGGGRGPGCSSSGVRFSGVTSGVCAGLELEMSS